MDNYFSAEAMDSFNEQLISVKKDAKTKAIQIAIYVVAALLIIGLGFFAYIQPIFSMFAFLLIFGVGYLAYFLASKLNVEYEYSVTNGEVDVDAIIAQKKRQRIITFKASEIESVKFCKGGQSSEAFSLRCCDTNEDFYIIAARDKNGNLKKVAMAPNEKLQSAMKKYMQYQVKIDAFNGN